MKGRKGEIKIERGRSKESKYLGGGVCLDAFQGILTECVWCYIVPIVSGLDLWHQFTGNEIDLRIIKYVLLNSSS